MKRVGYVAPSRKETTSDHAPNKALKKKGNSELCVGWDRRSRRDTLRDTLQELTSRSRLTVLTRGPFGPFW